MQTITIVGLAASICTGTSMLPQLVKLIKGKKADGISFAMLGILIAGLGMWVIYGVMKEDYIIIVSNGFSLLVAATILILRIRYK